MNRLRCIDDGCSTAWPLLLFCAVPRPNYFLRILHPKTTRVSLRNMITLSRAAPRNHPRHHMASGWVCGALREAGRCLSGPVGPTCCTWSVHVTPLWRETMLEGLNSDDPRHSHIQGAVVARPRLQDMGFRPPEWRLWPTVHVPWVPRS